jgi:hypothetical protein
MPGRDAPRVPSRSGEAGVDDPKTNWKAKAADAVARAKQFEEQARHEAKRAEKYRQAAERMEKRTASLEELVARLKVVERELAVAREHLMAVEVKLDILEGAANVLDLRTRIAIHETSETGASA